MEPQVISVSQFLAILNETMAYAFPAVTVEGEVSEYKVWKTLAFFKIKENDAAMDCMMPTGLIKTSIEDGMKIRLTGVPRFSGKGRYSFNGKSLELAGEGAIRRAFELLRRSLEAEGLFSPERKRPLPKYPRRIGLITSGDSAAYADFMQTLNTRWGGVTVELANVQVQGAPAVDQIVGAFNYFNQLAMPVDVVALVRGGGSLEDLQAFNTEPVARAVAGSRTPVIVGVGHEVDVSLADFAADVRAITPTNAAQLVVPDRHEELRRIGAELGQMSSVLSQKVGQSQQRIDRSLGRVEQFVRRPAELVERWQSQVLRGWERTAEWHRQQITQLERVVRAASPQANLERGYAIARANGRIVRDPAAVPAGAEVVLQLAKGALKTRAEAQDKS